MSGAAREQRAGSARAACDRRANGVSIEERLGRIEALGCFQPHRMRTDSPSASNLPANHPTPTQADPTALQRSTWQAAGRHAAAETAGISAAAWGGGTWSRDHVRAHHQGVVQLRAGAERALRPLLLPHHRVPHTVPRRNAGMTTTSRGQGKSWVSLGGGGSEDHLRGAHSC